MTGLIAARAFRASRGTRRRSRIAQRASSIAHRICALAQSTLIAHFSSRTRFNSAAHGAAAHIAQHAPRRVSHRASLFYKRATSAWRGSAYQMAASRIVEEINIDMSARAYQSRCILGGSLPLPPAPTLVIAQTPLQLRFCQMAGAVSDGAWRR